MNWNGLVWSYRGVLWMLVGSAFVGAYGCGTSANDCVERGSCGLFGSGGSGGVGANASDGSPEAEYYVLRVSTFNANAKAPECADGTPAEVYYAGPAGLPACTQCTCTATTRPECDNTTQHQLECTTKANPQPSDWVTLIPSGDDSGCVTRASVQSLATMEWCRVKAPIGTTGGAFTSQLTGNQLLKEDPWAVEISACKVRMDAASASNAVGICSQKGNNPCDTGWSETVVYRTHRDTRECTPCGGNFPDCTSDFIIFDTADCTVNAASRPIVVSTIATNVSSLANQYSMGRLRPIPPANCTSIGGEPEGSVEPKDPVTFCCK